MAKEEKKIPQNGNSLSSEVAEEMTLRVFEDLEIDEGIDKEVIDSPKGARMVLPDLDDDEEAEYVKPDARFKQKRPERELIRERLQKEIDWEARFNTRQKFLNYFTRSANDERMGFFKLVYNMAYAGGFLFNLFTVIVMSLIIGFITISLISGGLNNYFSLARAGVGIVLLVVMNYIHGQIKP